MITTVLFDLDGTLLPMDNDAFTKGYFKLLAAKLAPHGFFRVHRGYIVNLEYVEDVEVISSGILQLGINGIEGKKISVSRRRVVALKRALGL